MKKTLFLLFLSGMSSLAMAQKSMIMAGGGEYNPGKSACLSQDDYERINAMLATNIARLKAEGKLPVEWGNASPGTANKPTAGTFIWPLQQQAGLNYNSYYGISNYVDLNGAFPSQITDWNCGTRSYDLSSGYNHQGIDIFLWPFSQRIQENQQVAIIAAANGVIVGKENGNPDHSCAMGNDPWNAVYVGNTDGTVCWYGHMKNNSQTTKNTGESVSAGEILGFVGSSGSSTGPHLHFETHTAGGAVLEPFSGPCNNVPSLWANQKLYIEPTINVVLTHDRAPVFPQCPQLETINDEDHFFTGDTMYFASYYHDQTNVNASTHTIYRPDNFVFDTWEHTSNASYYNASYWFWSGIVDETFPSGQWHYTVTYQGNTVSRTFYVNVDPTGIAPLTGDGTGLSVFPNPNQGSFSIQGLTQKDQYNHFKITDISGRTIAEGALDRKQKSIRTSTKPTPGVYFLQLSAVNGESVSTRFVVQ